MSSGSRDWNFRMYEPKPAAVFPRRIKLAHPQALLVVVRVPPPLVSGTEHMRLPHERLQRRWKLSVVAMAYYGWA
jgi:hypothetical protein